MFGASVGLHRWQKSRADKLGPSLLPSPPTCPPASVLAQEQKKDTKLPMRSQSQLDNADERKRSCHSLAPSIREAGGERGIARLRFLISFLILPPFLSPPRPTSTVGTRTTGFNFTTTNPPFRGPYRARQPLQRSSETCAVFTLSTLEQHSVLTYRCIYSSLYPLQPFPHPPRPLRCLIRSSSTLWTPSSASLEC